MRISSERQQHYVVLSSFFFCFHMLYGLPPSQNGAGWEGSRRRPRLHSPWMKISVVTFNTPWHRWAIEKRGDLQPSTHPPKLRATGVITQTIEKTVACYIINIWNSKNASGHWIGRDNWDGRWSDPRRSENDFQTSTVCTRSKHWDREAEFSWPLLLLLLVFVSSAALVEYRVRSLEIT